MTSSTVVPATPVLIDARNIDIKWPEIERELATTELLGFDIETQDRNRHEGLNLYNNRVRHVFDHRRTAITGFSVHCKGSDRAYYFNMAHADVENRLPEGFGNKVIEAINPKAIVVAHNAPFEIVNLKQCWDAELPNIVCTLQMAVSHHSPDEYDMNAFYGSSLPSQFVPVARDVIKAFEGWDREKGLNGTQQELLGKFVAKESKAAHSYNGFVSSIAKGYALKKLTKSRFGYEQAEYYDIVGDGDMGDVTGEQCCAYGADDAFWAVKHYEWMYADMLANNPHALRAFFQQENPMIHVYADSWRDGIRLDLKQVFERRDIEREEMAKTLREFKAGVKALLPFPADPHEVLLRKEKWYSGKNGDAWAKKRKDIEAWANSPDSDDDFEQCFQVSNPIGNAWADEKGVKVPKSGKLNLVYYMGMRTLMYDLFRVPVQYQDGSVGSDKEARGRIRDWLDKEAEGNERLTLVKDLMGHLQSMADIEQRMKLYLTPYTQLMDPETSRVYPSLSSQLATRRLATSFPNPMQLAKSGSSAYIRSFYLGDADDHVVLSADWSAIELVLIGDLSGDAGFREVYGQLPYGDMHTGAAVDGLSVKTLPGLTEEEFREMKFGRNPNDRILKDTTGNLLAPDEFFKWARGTPVGKGINFSYWYSGALSSVAKNLGWTDDEHWEAVDKYRARFPEAEAWRVGVQEEAMLGGYIVLPDGHRRTRFEVTREWKLEMERKFHELSATPAMLAYADLAIRRIQGRARNQVVNALIQGSCATLAKRSVLNLKKLCADAGLEWGREYRLMMPIHDELVWSVHKDAVMTFLPLLRQAMTEHPDIVKTLPLHCTAAIGRTFRPFDKKNPASKFHQIELDEAFVIPDIIPKELEGTVLTDEKIKELLEWMYA